MGVYLTGVHLTGVYFMDVRVRDLSKLASFDRARLDGHSDTDNA
jgi:hypothetical protein